MADSNQGDTIPPQGGAQAGQDPLVPVPQTTSTSHPDPEPVAVVASEPPPAPSPRVDYAAQRKQERIDRLTAQKAALEQEVATLRAAQTPDAARLQAEIATQAAKLATTEAARISQWNTFTGALQVAINEGQKTFGQEKFDANVQALRSLHDNTDPATNDRYLQMLQAILDTGAAPKLIAQLGEDPNEAARIMGLTPTKMGVELGKLAVRDVDDVSRAPKPIVPVSGVGRTHAAIAAEDSERADGLDMRVWMERRSGHVQEVNKRAGRRVIP